MKDTSGPAFPVPSAVYNDDTQGMTLRAYLAAKAMQGLLSQPDERYFNPIPCHTVNNEGQTLDEWRQSICEDDAKYACMMADAMLKELEK